MWNTYGQFKSYGPSLHQRQPEYFMNSVLTHFSFCHYPQNTVYIKTLTHLHHSFIVPEANLWCTISKVLKGNSHVFDGQSVSMANLLLDLPLITDTEDHLMQLHLESWFGKKSIRGIFLAFFLFGILLSWFILVLSNS